MSQGMYTVHPAVPGQTDGMPQDRKSRTPVADRTVTLVVRDSTIKYVVNELTRQAKLQPLYSDTSTLLNRRIRVRLIDTDIMEALTTVLKGTGLIAKLSVDGETVMIRSDAASTKVASAEAGSITGRVIDSVTRKGIDGVALEIAGAKLVEVTRDNGRFRFAAVPSGTHTISAKLLGYQSRNVSVNVDSGKAVQITIVLPQASTVLAEVVTTSTGRQRRVEVGHDVAVIKADSLLRIAPIRSVSDLLAIARVPGVTVESSSGLPGAPSRIRIRGIGSLMGDNDPVVILDGVRINASTSGASLQSALQDDAILTSRLDDIDPETIETIEILRGPSAGALYGADAANGVIVITTRKGIPGQTRWDFSVAHDWNGLTGPRPTQYAGWGRAPTSDAAISCNINSVIAGACVQDSVSLYTPENEPLLRSEARGATTVYTARMSGGVQQFNYSLTASTTDELGPTKMREIDRIWYRNAQVGIPGSIARPTGLTRNRVSGNITVDPGKGYNLGLNIQVDQMDRFINKGTTKEVSSGERDTMLLRSPVINRRSETVNRMTLGVTTAWTRWSWITPTAAMGLDRSVASETEVQDRYECLALSGCSMPQQGRGESRSNGSRLSFNVRSVLAPLGGAGLRRWIELRPSFGMDMQRQSNERVTLEVDTVLSGGLAGGPWSSNAEVRGDSTRSATAGVYLDLQYKILQRFYSSVGMRWDVGSGFGKKSGAQPFPKLNTSWLISDEPFFPSVLPINSLRLRFAFGVAGVQPVAGAVDGGYLVSQSVVNGQVVKSIMPYIVGNPRLKPERALEFEYGFDIETLAQRLNFMLNVVSKRGKNLIVAQALPPSVSGSRTGKQRYDNVALVLTRTVELMLDSRVIDRPNLLWTLIAKAGTTSARVGKVGKIFVINGISNKGRIVEGYPIGGRWESPVLGYSDVNGDGLLAASEVIRGDSLVYMGWSQPRYTVTYGTSLSTFNGLLTMTADLAQDVGITQSIGCAMDNSTSCASLRGLQDVQAPLLAQLRARGCGLFGACTAGGALSQTVSVLRWNAASVTANIPSRWIRALRGRTMSISVSGRNLAVWTNYSGRDPSVNEDLGETRTDPGNLIPPPRTYSLSVRFGL